MLYNNFIVCVMTCATFALMHMLVYENYTYIILPIGIILWGIFKFFDADDRKYLESLGIDPDDFNPFFPEWSEGTYGTYYSRKENAPRIDRSKNTLTWDSPSDVHRRTTPSTNTNAFGNIASGVNLSSRRYSNPAYKTIAKKCKRNFNISIE